MNAQVTHSQTSPPLASFQTVAKEYRYRIKMLFLSIAIVFGLVSYFFFEQTIEQAAMIFAGLAITIFACLTPSRLAYTLTEEAIDKVDLSGDTLSLHTFLPAVAAIFILAALFLAWPAQYYLYIGVLTSVTLRLARLFFPVSTATVSETLLWADIDSIYTEQSKYAILLSNTKDNSTTTPMLVYCSKDNYQEILAVCARKTNIHNHIEATLIK